MSTFDTPENNLSNVEGKSDMMKVRTSLVNSSSTLFLCLIHTLYNRVNCAKKTSHVEIIHSWYYLIDCSEKKLLYIFLKS